MKSCVVCGMGSPREDWINEGDGYVACDHHSKEEIQEAVAATAPPAPKPDSVPTQASPGTVSDTDKLKALTGKPINPNPPTVKI